MAAATYYSAVQKAYIAFYGRPADQVGLEYWAGQLDKANGNLASIINAFGTSAEAKALYGSKSNLEAIEAVYVQIFGRSADAEGLKYYGAELAAGRMTLVDIAQRIADGAKGADATIITNKLTAAQAFTDAMDTSAEILAYSGDAAAATVRAWLGGVTAEAASVTTATSAIAGALTGLVAARATAGNPGQTITLTTGVDTPVGGSADDSILGTVDSVTATNATFSVADVINGGSGSDTLQITAQNITGNTTFTPTQVTNVESVRVINVDPTAGDTVTLNLNSTSGVTKAEASSSSQPVTFDNVANAGVLLSAVSNTGAVAFNVKTSALTGSSDSVNLSLNSNTGGVTVNTDGAGFEAATIAVAGTNSGTLIGAGANIKSVTVTGTGSLVVGGADLTAATLFDASAASADLTYDATALNATVKGGSGNDTLTDGAGNDMITGGAGNDTITGGTGNDNINAGAGDDRVVLTAVTKEDTVVGGDGTDTLSIATAIAYSATTATDDSVNIKGFEALTTTAALTQNMLGLSANNTITSFVIGASGTTTLQNAAIASVTGSTAGNVTLGLKTNGTADSLAITAGDAANSAARAIGVNATQYETVTINSVGANGNSVTLGTTNAGDGVTAATAATATSLTSLTVTGSKNLTVTGSGVDTALATINAADFAGSTLSLTGFATATTGAAMTVTATGAYEATVTTGGGADAITGGSGNDNLTGNGGNDTISGGIGNDTISGGLGNNVLTGGTGNDNIIASTGNDNIDGGDGNDTITADDGTNTVVGGAGDDTVTAGSGADSVTGGDGNDTITVNAGNDTVDGGAGNDSISGGTGSDSLVGGAGNDTLDGSTGDDTLLGGDGNDIMTLASLTNGDSVDGGAGTDRLTITAIASDATPRGITGVEDFRVTTLGGGGTSITVDLANVSGITALQTTLDQNDTTTLTVKNLPSTVTTLSIADDGQTTDTNVFSYSSGPSSLTLNSFGSEATATNITSLNAPLTIVAKLNTDVTGEAQVFSNQVTNLGTMTTDATSITISTDNLISGQGLATTELTVGAITANVLESLNVTAGNYAQVVVSSADLTTSSSEFASAVFNTGTGGTVTIGELIANSATKVSLTYNTGAQGSLALNNGAKSSFTSAALTVSGNLGNQSSLTYSTNGIVGDSITSNTWTVGSGVGSSGAYVALPTLEVDATTGTIGSTSITAGVASYVSQSIGATTTPKSIGAVTLLGEGNISVTLGATTAATSATLVNAQGNVSAAGMTSPLSSATINASASISKFVITGGAGNDTITVGNAANTVSGGVGADTVNLEANGGAAGSLTRVLIAVGDSNPVVGGNNADTGQDTVNHIGAAGADVIVVTGTSTDISWDHTTHVLMGDGAGANANSAGDEEAYTTATALVQFGDITLASDSFDIAFLAYSDAATTAISSDANLQAVVAVNLTGTGAADTFVMGDQADTVYGLAGNDNIDGNNGGDYLDGGAGNDTYTYGAAGDSNLEAAVTSTVDLDTVVIATGDVINTALTETLGASGAMTTITLAAGAEADGTAVIAAIAAGLTEVANAAFLIKIVDGTTDTLGDGTFSGYYLVVCSDTTFSDNDYLIKLSGVSDSSTIAVATGGGIGLGG